MVAMREGHHFVKLTNGILYIADDHIQFLKILGTTGHSNWTCVCVCARALLAYYLLLITSTEI